ncbi:MAG: hypothetical protein DSY57_03865 [Desulfobulbus sp.]|nr:MAG: hypothetical protein DSY57_03865 [Desulfobulbus sp.]
MQMREAAERILFSQTLEEKLDLAPESVSDDSPGKAIGLPDAPGRPAELVMNAKSLRVDFPGMNKLHDDHERGKTLHFLANHELLAAELMALVLLRFPDAPKEYRQGVYEAMREEQMHTLMYMRRMKECGVHFGELPVNDYFWKLIAPMQTPMDFVTRLNLTFEQSNLDFSKHYAGLFRQAGDDGTGLVLEKIYRDEIGHVGHGVKWFRKWKEQGETDWNAFKKCLTFPLVPAKARGMAPYNAEGRRLAGLDEDFISHLEICVQSRGRTPVVHWFNPNAESYVAAEEMGWSYHPHKMESAMERDLEMLSMAWCRTDDILLMREHPGNAHLAYLQKVGFELPEVLESVEGRKLGGLRPWAWSPDARDVLEKYAEAVSSRLLWQWRAETPARWFSKEIGMDLSEKLGVSEGAHGEGVFCKDLKSAQGAIQNLLKQGDVLIKAAYSCAGRGHRRIQVGETEGTYLPWLEKMMELHGGVAVEPWLERVCDFSVLYEMRQEKGEGVVKWIGMTHMENDASGRFLGSVVFPKWTNGLDAEISEFLHREARVRELYRERVPEALAALLVGYSGPVGVDAMVFRKADGSLGLRRVIELNVRMTMGRVALELQKKLPAARRGRFRILRKKALSESELSDLCERRVGDLKIVLNHPETAREFIAVWER